LGQFVGGIDDALSYAFQHPTQFTPGYWMNKANEKLYRALGLDTAADNAAKAE